MTSLPAMSLGLRFCISRKGGTGGGGWVRSHLVGPPFPEFKACFSATAGWHFSRDLTRRLLIGGCGQGHVSAKHG